MALKVPSGQNFVAPLPVDLLQLAKRQRRRAAQPSCVEDLGRGGCDLRGRQNAPDYNDTVPMEEGSDLIVLAGGEGGRVAVAVQRERVRCEFIAAAGATAPGSMSSGRELAELLLPVIQGGDGGRGRVSFIVVDGLLGRCERSSGRRPG